MLCLRYRYQKQSSHEMTQNAYIRSKSLYTIILYIREGIWVISCHDCYRPLTFDVRMSLNVFRTPILFSQALEFRTPLFPHLVPSAIMVWIFVWKYISLNHLSIFYNISYYNSLILLTFVSRSSCRITYILLERETL